MSDPGVLYGIFFNSDSDNDVWPVRRLAIAWSNLICYEMGI